MKKIKLTAEEKKTFIDYMLNNEELEKAIQKGNKGEPLYQISILYSIISRCKYDAGLIIAVKSSEIPVGIDNIELYTELTKHCEMHCAAMDDGTKYVMAFTSKSRFLDDLSGVVIPIDVFIGMMCLKKDEIDGIVINWGKEEIIIKMQTLEFLYNCIRELYPEPK